MSADHYEGVITPTLHRFVWRATITMAIVMGIGVAAVVVAILRNDREFGDAAITFIAIGVEVVAAPVILALAWNYAHKRKQQ